MKRVLQSPSWYIQEDGALLHLAEYMKKLGGVSAYILTDAFAAKSFAKILPRSFLETGARYHIEELQGECCLPEVDRHCALLRQTDCDFVIGIGGGKALDTAKAVSHYARLPVMAVPTAASMDGPCSGLAVLYTEEGVFDRYLHLRTSPAAVAVDTGVIAKAPARLLSAGMGDALSTCYEAEACCRSQGITDAGGVSTNVALALARLCRETLFRDGVQARLAAECGVVTPALENIVEANLYLSCIGFESGGLAAAHALANGLTLLPALRSAMHGEVVAFCTLAQLVLENRPMEELRQVLSFCRSIQLPVTLEGLGAGDCKEEDLFQAAQASLGENSYMHHMPFAVTAQSAFAALRVADRLGQDFLREN